MYSKLVGFLLMFGASIFAMETDNAIFLFDHGEKNHVAAMLEYADQKNLSCDFKIVFMGPAVDAMHEEPFCRYPQQLVHYKQLGIQEEIGKHWKRDGEISPQSLANLKQNLCVRKKVWTGVSCKIFAQILQLYSDVETVALRDNPFPDGASDYFRMAKLVQRYAKILALPSRAVAEEGTSFVLIGHAPTEQWVEKAGQLEKESIRNRLGISDKTVVVYAGSYGEGYERAFKQFLEIAAQLPYTVLVIPHPRFKGEIEKKLCSSLPILTDTPTIEALTIADVVVTSDPTSTIVLQASALGKKVLCVNPTTDPLLQFISTPDAIISAVETNEENTLDVFSALGIPKEGARLLWDRFK